MAFKKFKARLGAGAASVDAQLNSPVVTPGGTVEGVVVMQGGDVAQEIRSVGVALVARVEVETSDSEYDANLSFNEQHLGGGFEIEPGQEHQLPFQLGIPIETPFNVVEGQELSKVRIGVRTELDIPKARDRSDLDPLQVHALPAQSRILGAVANLGFRFKGSDLEKGHIQGATLPFYQEVEFAPSQEFQGKINELEVTFLSREDATDVILEVDKRGGLLTEGQDATNRFTVPFDAIDAHDWEAQIQATIAQLGQKRGLFG